MIVINAEKPIPPKEVKPVERAFSDKFQFHGDSKNYISFYFYAGTDYYGEFQTTKQETYAGKGIIGRMFINQLKGTFYLKGRNSNSNKVINTKCRWYYNGLVEDVRIRKMIINGRLDSTHPIEGSNGIRITFKIVSKNSTLTSKEFTIRNSTDFSISIDNEILLKTTEPIYFEIHYSYTARSVVTEREGSNSVPDIRDLRVDLYP